MAGLNVAEWTPEQVGEWMSGLGPTVAQYVPALKARGLDGVKLLTLRCDDLEYLGMHVIGHQELLLEAVEHLRNFHYELSRECIQQLALRVSVVATTLVRALRQHTDVRLETQILADVARTVNAVKPLVCWLDRWSLGEGGGGAGAARRAELLRLSLEAATCAQRDRFAEQPARAVCAAAAATAAAATYIVQEVSDPGVLGVATLAGVSLRQRGRALGFEVRASFCGHHQVADVRFGSPAHASGAVHPGDEVVQVGARCVVGWSGAAVEAACVEHARDHPLLPLRLRRRAHRPPPAVPRALARPRTLYPPHPHTPHPPPRLDVRNESSIIRKSIAPAEPKEASECATCSSDESGELSPPASPTHMHPDHTRMYPEKPPAALQRRHSVSGGTPRASRTPHAHAADQFWQRLKEQSRGAAPGSTGISPELDDIALYARDKAVSYSTGLELTPRPRTCLGSVPERRPPGGGGGAQGGGAEETERARGKLDKAHSTPAYDLGEGGVGAGAVTVAAAIPESPSSPHDRASPSAVGPRWQKADQILQFKKCSSQIGEAMQLRPRRRLPEPAGPDPLAELRLMDAGTGERDETTAEKIVETINIAVMEHRRRSLLEGTRLEPRNLKLSASDCGRTIATPTEEKVAPRYSYLRTAGRARPSPPPSPPPRVGAAAPPSLPLPAPQPPSAPLPVLRAVPRGSDREPTSPMKPIRLIDATQISVPLRHITKHDIRMIPAEQNRPMPAINIPPALAPATPPTPTSSPSETVGGAGEGRGTLSPTSAVRGIFPTSKSRSLKKKSSILAKRRSVPCRLVAGRGGVGGGGEGAGGAVWQRVRSRSAGPAAQPRWVRRHLLLAHNLLYAYRSAECAKADCMIYLEGYTVCAAGEVKSRAHAFKVYHTGNAFYFACETRDAMLAWIQLIHRATLLPSLLSHVDVSRQFSETDYSETESDTDSPEKRTEKDKDKEKDKSKFGSLKKLTGRMQRSESQENVGHSSTSLDRKYLRFFSRHKSKDDSKPKSKQSNVPVPTEHYRSYRRVPLHPPDGPSAPTVPSALTPARPKDTLGSELRASKKIPKPINYIHASNPNLLDFEKSDFVMKPTLQVPTKPKVAKAETLVGLVTLEQFMLKKQEEERRQLYSNRVLLGIERDRKQLQHRLDRIVPDVIYGEVGTGDVPLPVLELQAASASASALASAAATATAAATAAPVPASNASYKERRPEPGKGKPISVKGKDGYEKIVYTDDPPDDSSEGATESYVGYGVTPPRRPAPPPAPERWRDSLRRNDKVHTTPAGKGPPLGAAPAPATPPPTLLDTSGESSGGGGGPGPGVSRLRLMFGGSRAHAQTQSPQPAAAAVTPPAAPPRSGATPPRSGATPPRSGATPPRSGATPPRSGATAPQREDYPHLQCPPTFQPESYSLATHPRRPRDRDDDV